MVTNTTKKGLGRGLSSLMGDTETTQTKNTNVGQETKIPIANLKPSPSQPRRLFNKNMYISFYFIFFIIAACSICWIRG